MFTSKLADAKSALCKRTAGTPKKKKKKNPSPEPRTIPLSSQYTDITWNRLNLNTSGKGVWTLQLQMNKLWQEYM